MAPDLSYNNQNQTNSYVTQELFETAILLKCDPCIIEEYALECVNKIKEILINNII